MNICFRFCLGNTDLSQAKGLFQIMEDYAVVAWTDQYMIALYGRPADLVEATIKSFYLCPETSPNSPSSSCPLPASSSSSSHPLTSNTITTPLTAAAAATPLRPARSPSIEILSLEDLQIRFQEAQSPPGKRKEYKGKGKEVLSRSSSSSMNQHQDTASTSTSNMQTEKDDNNNDDDDDDTAKIEDPTFKPLRKNPWREKLPPHKWKTDYDLWAEKHPASDLKKKIRRRNGQPPFQIMIALPENIRLYLLTVSGGFTSYLMEEKTVGACHAQGGVLEDLLEARDEAEMKVSDSREYNMTVVETMDLEALRRVLLGVTTALATEPVKEYTEKWMKEHYAKDLEEWDQTLKVYRATHEDARFGWVTEDLKQEDEEETWIADDHDMNKEEGAKDNMYPDIWTWTNYEGVERYSGKAKKKRR